MSVKDVAMAENKEDLAPGMLAHRNRCGNKKSDCDCSRCWPVGPGRNQGK